MRNIGHQGLGHWLLSIGVLLLLLEQTHMATIDLRALSAVKAKVSETAPVQEQLQRFHRITISTIAMELLGFYMAGVNLGWGVVTVLTSQVWFHLFAGVELHPTAVEPIKLSGPLQRPVLLADGVGIILAGFWLAGIAPVAIGAVLLGIGAMYGGVKYGWPLVSKLFNRS